MLSHYARKTPSFLTASAAILGAVACLAASQPQPAGPPGQPVVVTNFAPPRPTETAFPGLRQALLAMAKDMPTSRALAACPISGQQVRVIRTGARWAAFPRSAVFLLLGSAQAGPDLVFAGQQQYIQYLARHPEAAKRRPKPLRVEAAIKEILTAKPSPAAPGSPPASAASAPATAAKTP